MARKKRNPNAEKLAESILNTYQPESVDDMQEALKDGLESIVNPDSKM